MMKNPSLENKALELALRYLAHKPRSIYEMREYLTKKNFDENIVNPVIKILLKRKYLDDGAFAESFVESRAHNKPKSKFALTYELHKKGIEPLIIEDVLKDYNDSELALKALESKVHSWAHLDRPKLNLKILNFLKYRGFSYDISISLLNTLKPSGQDN